MDIYEMIEYGIRMGLLTIEIARELRGYFQRNDGKFQNEENLQKVIEEMLKYMKEQNSHASQKEPFSNIGWLSQFMTVAQDISDASMQEICGRILAQEFASPGVTPQRMAQILSGISFEDMQKFQVISSMSIGIITDYNNDSIDGPHAKKHIMVPFRDSDEYSQKIGVFFKDINELQALGLLTYSSDGYYISGVSCKHPLIYANGKTFYILWHRKDEIPTGNILLTKAGECLSDVMNECEIVDEYAEYVRGCMEHFGVAFAEQEMYSVSKTDGRFILSSTKKR